MPLNTGFVLNNRYRIVKLLGQGGFGAVYRAWDTALSRPCAVKENLELAPESQRQFSLEASILANLSHANLPRVIDHFILPGQGQYLVMDFIEGEDLGTRLQQTGKMRWDEIRPWVEQIVSAVVYLHSQPNPVIHRDIKPSNIRITPDGRAFLVDFGLVKYYDPQLRTTRGARAVTPGYSPPEQYGQAITDARTDIYALAATIYSLLTNLEPPESVARLVSDTLLPPRRVDASIPQPVEQALLKAMQIRPADRFASMAEFAQALLRFAPQQQPGPVRVAPPAGMGQGQAAGGYPSYGQQGQAQAYPPAQKKGGFPWVGCLLGVVGMSIVAVVVLGILTAQIGSNQAATAVAEENSWQETATAEAWFSLQMTEAAEEAWAATESAATQQASYLATAQAETLETTEAVLRQPTVNPLGGVDGTLFGPSAGELELIEGRSVLDHSNLSVGNFITEVTFTNPYNVYEVNWDYGFFFRDQADVQQYRLVIASNNTWALIYQTQSDTGTILQRGDLTNLVLGDGMQNKLTLMCMDGQGYFSLNDVFIANLDLSRLTAPGDVSVASGVFTGNQIAGEITSYSGFTVWELP